MSEARLVKEEQQKLEQAIHEASRDPGVQLIREWAWSAREVLNSSWQRMTPDQLPRAQGYKGNLDDLIRIIDDGPKIKPVIPEAKPAVTGGA